MIFPESRQVDEVDDRFLDHPNERSHRDELPIKVGKNPWKPKKIIYEPTNEKLSASAGLGPLIDAFMQSPEFSEFKACLPERIGNSSYSSEHLAMILLCGFWYGHECLDDLEEFAHDPSVEDKLGGLATLRRWVIIYGILRKSM